MWDSLVSSVHILLCNPVGHNNVHTTPAKCLPLWQSQQLNVSVLSNKGICTARICSEYAWCQLYLSCHCWKQCITSAPVSMVLQILHTLPPSVNFHWCNTHRMQKSKHTSYFKFCHGSFNSTSLIWVHCDVTYLWWPLMAVQQSVPVAYYMLRSADLIMSATKGIINLSKFVNVLCQVKMACL